MAGVGHRQAGEEKLDEAGYPPGRKFCLTLLQVIMHTVGSHFSTLLALRLALRFNSLNRYCLELALST